MFDATAQRILRATAGTLTFSGFDSTGEPANVGTVTVGVVASDGSTVIAAGTATTGTTTKSVPFTVALSALCERWAATWKVGADTVGTTEHEVVGGVYFPVSELRTTEISTVDPHVYTVEALQSARAETETVFERHMNVAQVPRFAVVDVCGNGSMLLTNVRFPRRVAWCWVYSSDTEYTELTPTECADLVLDVGGQVSRSAGWYGRVRLGLEHGLDRPPPDVRRAAMKYCRYLADRSIRQNMPERAQAWVTTDAGTMGFRKPNPTGIEDVDIVLNDPQNRWPEMGIA